jgi:hypothetical protein
MTLITMTSNNNLSLQNLESYNKELLETPIEVFFKYNEIISEFIVQFSNVSTYAQNELYTKYLFTSGINTVTNIFNMVSLYTMNMELTKYYCNIGSYYYSEFTEQMISDHTSFLKLSTKDAILFVYKKTIFEINDDYKNNISLSESSNNKFSIINLLIKLYNDILINVIDKSNLIKADIRIFYKEVLINGNNIFNMINNLYTSTNNINNSLIYQHLKLFTSLIEILKIQLKNNEDKMLLICEIYLKKISKLDVINIDKIERKIRQEKFNELVVNAYDSYNINKLINWLLQ